MKVLVTGGSGLLGTELTRRLSLTGHKVFSTYRAHPPRYGQPVLLDMTATNTIEGVVKKLEPDVIIHTAAISDVDLCEEKPNIANLVNGEATGKISEAAGQLGVYLIYLSTDYVFDGEIGSYREVDKPSPVNQYGSSKLAGEELMKESGATHCIARTSVIYGWNRAYRLNFASWVLHGLAASKPLSVVDDQFASPTLNSNLAEMTIELADKRFEGIIHLAGATRIDRYNFAKRIAKTFHYDQNLIQHSKTNPMAWKAKRPPDSSLNVEIANTILYNKPFELPAALARFSASPKPYLHDSHAKQQ